MQILLAMKKQGETVESALFVDNKFSRSATDTSVSSLLTRLVTPLLKNISDGSEVSVNIGVLDAGEIARLQAREERARQTAEAEAEAAEIEKLNAALAREHVASSGPMMADGGKSGLPETAS